MDGELVDRGLATPMVPTVHDELVFEVPEAEQVEARAVLVETLEGVSELAVSLKVDARLGATWADAKG